MGRMMDINHIKSVFKNYSQIGTGFNVKVLTSGHINKTLLITNEDRQYILQKVNTDIFKNLQAVTDNIQYISDFLQSKNYPHQLIKPLKFKTGSFLYKDQWRLSGFIENTLTFEKVQSQQQCYEAAKFLSEFHYYLKDSDTSKINDSIEGFLDFESRNYQYTEALEKASDERKKEAQNEILFIEEHLYLLIKWLEVLPRLPKRIIHADPKISNFLFDKNNPSQILSLIDWDTFMKGSILYDFGDMARSYTNLKEEDDPSPGDNFSWENYTALKKGFLSSLHTELTEEELSRLDLAAQTVIYIQAMRFLTDFLNGDIYYQISHPIQNLDRTKNQINLLKEFIKEIRLLN